MCYKKPLLFTIILCCQQFYVLAQNDSLLKIIQSPKEDTNKVNAYQALIRKIEAAEPQKAINYGKEALTLAKKLKWEKGIAEISIRMGYAYRLLNDSVRAFTLFFSALDIAERNRLKVTESKAAYNIASAYYYMSMFKKAIPYFQRCVVLDRELKDVKLEADDNTFLATCYLGLTDYPKAINEFEKSIEVYKSIKERQGEMVCLINISGIFFALKDMNRALYYDSLALRIANETKDSFYMPGVLTNMGSAYAGINNNKALEYYRIANQIATKKGINGDIAYSLSRIGNVYLQTDSLEKAKYYLFEALEKIRATGERENEALVLADIANYYNKTRQYRKCIEYCNKTIAVINSVESVKQSYYVYNVLSTAYENLNMPKEALAAYKKFAVTRDSVLSQDKEKATIRNEIQFDYTRRQFKDSLQHAQAIQLSAIKLSQQKLIWYISLFILTGVIILIVLLKNAKIRRTRKEQEAFFSRQLLETELKALRAQMNPHFIFNCLNSIQVFILREQRMEATEYLQKFSKLIRMILDNSQKTSNTIEDEAEILSLYMDLEKLRLKNKFDYEIKIPENVDASFTEIPSMIIQPIVENSIWHGFTNDIENGKLKVEFIKEENKLTCLIEDNGIGRQKSMEIKKQKNSGHVSKGTKLIEDRLKAWSYTHGLQFNFTIFDNVEDGKGTRTEISILYPAYA